ncbi:tRNA uridine-5-carboxymethylaminomethyl(34) synthesis GTPase MnmE [Moraxella equi]|uniref:tRNA modification GTPase MnmE n=1 Tax=Moraxella equi TaxID=60442 RepID=A0A378QST1_9GAMM|nr:tRNA uridine-5-carboxymethylaminomethyl(34) synthesis GTPase MnmE [Moraxella equi]OPH35903.1 tRNA uridine-5-carboxymethylaminomethyl(34) synthesis GTPase MnmE [Moraxella equi]STZ03947.1 tRNA modification GTPase MnmE [Moraxella equi]
MPNQSQQPTIVAIASPIGQGGVGVIRLSGRTAHTIGCAISGKSALTPRHAHFAKFKDAQGAVIDEGVIIYFKAPHSFTGEDVVELQGHGGMVLQNLLLARCFELGARQAAAGEFSLRAFENDKIDLVQAEAIADAISATSVAQASSAMRSLSGEFSKKINDLSEKIANIRLYVEASIDFPDEDDVEFLSDGVIESKIDEILRAIDDISATAKQGQLLRDGVQVVLAGRPNAGKSSLLNRLAGVERAIVTDIAGTTRDTLSETLVLDGLTVHLTDTAGLRDTSDKVEKIGIDRAKSAVKQADILLFVYDVSSESEPFALAKELFADIIDEIGMENFERKLVMIANKADLLGGVSRETMVDFNHNNSHNDENVPCETMQNNSNSQENSNVPRETISQTVSQIRVSCTTGQGLDELVNLLKDKVGFHPPENSLIARTRHIDALKRAKSHAMDAHTQLVVYQAGELVAESLRLSQTALGEITGQMSADELLGRIFSSFCIGK